jgi:hypothetical protein
MAKNELLRSEMLDVVSCISHSLMHHPFHEGNADIEFDWA